MASEVLKVALSKEITNTEKVLLTVTSGHTFTVLNVSICETAGNAETFDLYIDDNAGGTDYEIYSDQALAANATFEHTTRLTMIATDVLYGRTADSADVDVVITYLDQTL